MGEAAGDKRDVHPLQRLHGRGRGQRCRIAVPELPVHAPAPREDGARVGRRSRVRGAARDARHHDTLERHHARGGRHVACAGASAMPELAKVPPAPRPERAALFERQRVRGAACHARDHAAVEPRDDARQHEALRVAVPELPGAARAPRVDASLLCERYRMVLLSARPARDRAHHHALQRG